MRPSFETRRKRRSSSDERNSRSRRDEGENAVTFDDVRKVSPAARIG